MTARGKYTPGPAAGARVQKDGEQSTLVLVRQFPHPPSLVWRALTDAEELMRWFPFDSHRLEAVFVVLGFDRDEVRLEARHGPGARRPDSATRRWLSCAASSSESSPR